MQRDKVLGLSLAILLIGFAGAFCFRNEASSIFNSGPQLQNPRALDDVIAGKEGPKPYTGDLQGTKPNASGVTLEGIVAERPFKETSEGVPSSDPKRNNAGWELPDFLKPKSVEPQRDLSQTRNSPTSNNPQTQTPQQRQDAWFPKQNQGWQTVPGQTVSSSTAAPNNLGTMTGHGREHRVTIGDTLTGLAARYLGSSARYMEIYEANRDVLRSPDDLRSGMTLRIPQERTTRNSVMPVSAPEARQMNDRNGWGNRPSQTRAGTNTTGRGIGITPTGVEQSREARPRNDSLGLPSKFFVPVKRSPFLPQSSGSTQGLQRSGSLSQNSAGSALTAPRYEFFPRPPQQTADRPIDAGLPVLR